MNRVPRLSQLLVPVLKKGAPVLDTTDLLVKNGYIRQSSSGCYNLLPLGLRVVNRIETIIRNRMDQIGGAEVQLTSLSPATLWKQSGRFYDKEFYHIDDDKYVLAPTCEEEVTHLVSKHVDSYRQLPLRLYQLTRKYRDEKRPRGGLLRTKEFIMKDMYSFDGTAKEAHATYDEVTRAYMNIFSDLSIPVARAEADSGSIGGDLSHEYHCLSDAGEDTVLSCPSCSYTANREKAISYSDEPYAGEKDAAVQYFVTHDRDTLVAAYYPPDRVLNVPAVKDNVDDIDFECKDAVAEYTKDLSQDSVTKRLVRIMDARITPQANLPELPFRAARNATTTLEDVPIVEAQEGEICPECDKPGLVERRAIEVAHTFYLGTKYSAPMKASATGKDDKRHDIEMGCFGIGVSRLVNAIAETTKDSEGLKWPSPVSPFTAVVASTNEIAASEVIDRLRSANISAVWDDRSDRLGSLLGMSRSLGLPYTIVVGRDYSKGKVEVQRRDRVKGDTDFVQLVSLDDLPHVL
uniref:proline--tRNA ligase n=1 Tax=Blastobotrys adeninivorans TaxID=409370 RepID=A0A060SWL7_BLAAD